MDENSADEKLNMWLTATFENFKAYKNREGIRGKKMGAVVFKNSQVADHRFSGIGVDIDMNSREGIGYVDGALVVGYTVGNNEIPTDVMIPDFEEGKKLEDGSFTPMLGNTYIGIWAPRSERWSIRNSKFYNYDFGSGALSTCLDCTGYHTKD